MKEIKEMRECDTFVYVTYNSIDMTAILNWHRPKTLMASEEIDWEPIYQEALPRIYNFFRYRVGDDALAEDLTATTFEKAWRARARYRRDLAAFSTWLFTIARNVAADQLRQQRDHVSLDALRDQPTADNLETLIEQQDEFARLAALLARLPLRERELIALKYGADLTNRAIAGVMGLSESNVGTILHRITRELRAQLEA